MTKSAPSMHGSGVAWACTGTPGAIRAGQVGDHRQARLVDVVEVDAIDAERRAGETADQQRHAHAGAADDGQLHALSGWADALSGPADASGPPG